MADESQENLNSPSEIRQFKIEDVLVKQKERVTKLEHLNFGATFLIDVTDSEDPTTKDNEQSNGKIIGQILAGKMNNENFQDHYATNNGVIVLITDKFDSQNRMRVYLGLETVDVADKEKKEVTSHFK